MNLPIAEMNSVVQSIIHLGTEKTKFAVLFSFTLIFKEFDKLMIHFDA